MAQSCGSRCRRAAVVFLGAGVLSFSACGKRKKETVEELVIPEVPTADAVAEMSGKELFGRVCAVCHGPNGEGNYDLKAPSIAGLPDWYVKIQIEKFRKDFRGTDVRDLGGQQMHSIVGTVLDEEATEKVAAEIAALKFVPMKVTLGGGDPEEGAYHYRERCMECHRFNGHGEVAFRSPPLIGFQDWYVISQLKKYQDGIRGGREGDIDGAKMHLIAEGMSERQMRDITTHMAELAEKYADWVPRRERRMREAAEAAGAGK